MNNEKIITYSEFLQLHNATSEDIASKVARSTEQMQADGQAWRDSYIKRMDALFALPEEKVTAMYGNIRMNALRKLGILDAHTRKAQEDDGEYTY